MPVEESPQPSITLLRRWFDMAGPALALILIFLLFWALIGRSFISFSNNIQPLLAQSAIVSMAALGMTFVIASGGIDLSTGSSVAYCAVMVAVILNLGNNDPKNHPEIAWVLHQSILIPLLAILTSILVGAAAGAINGLIIAGLRIVPFIVTLGTMMVFRGLAKAFSHESAVYAPQNGLMTLLDPPESHRWLLFSTGIWLVIALAILMATILNYTRFGRHLLAIGSNEQTARLCGIPVTTHKIAVYALAGLFAGLAGILQYARTTQGNPSAATGLELDVIAAVVIGGASLNGGRGSIFGTLVGALIMNVIRNGCSQVPIPAFAQPLIGSPIGLPTYVQEIVTGIIIIIAVALDNLRQRRAA